MKKFFGFTLSEMLVAITVVGIIASLTIPAIISNHRKTLYVLALKKAYVDLQNNLTTLQGKDYRKTLTDSLSQNLYIHDNLIEGNYNVTKTCNHDDNNITGCFATSYKSMNGDSANFTCENTKGGEVLLKNGVALCIEAPPANADYAAIVYIDVNGKNGPNIGGRDMFKLFIYNDASIDVVSPTSRAGNADNTRISYFNQYCRSSAVGRCCFGKIYADNWKMNY